ncbi:MULTISPECIES: hypothetical protein [unclassified Bradyrhizobium]|uniref:hypothetical protein n=1 Tax=unclassified Bradyrhizobium TaxID=2631580 RepID=UPI002915DFE8|nr:MULTISPECIES: hypothetical protein [unclassified Bradyrhizobium]
MTWLFSLLTGLPGFLNGLLAYLNKKQDTAAVFNTNSKDVSIATIQAETARINATRDVLTVAMSHPIWWVAWAIGVFPVMVYYACIFWVSTFPFWGWTVQKAPADALDFAKLVVGSMFAIGGASSVIAGIAHAWKQRA